MLLKSKAIATLTALSLGLSLSLTAAAPAHALGKSERKFLQGIAAALVVGAIVNEGRKSRRTAAPEPEYRQPAYQAPQPTYQRPKPTYRAPKHAYKAPRNHEQKHKTGRIIGKTSAYGSGVNETTAARVFNSYTRTERLNIQRNLARFGYYNGAIDGSFGPRTHQAVFEFARSAGKQDALGSTAGSFQVYNALLS